MFDEEYYKPKFKDHIATFTDYGNIKILDFKRPDSREYRIRFLFEEDYDRLHITGDLGELIASNHNMHYEKFLYAYGNDPGYFREKVDTHSRPFYYYDRKSAEDELTEMAQKYLWIDAVDDDEEYTAELDDFLYDVLVNFDEERCISPEGYTKLRDYDYDCWEYADDIGKVPTDIVEGYLLAFKLAWAQLHPTTKTEQSSEDTVDSND